MKTVCVYMLQEQLKIQERTQHHWHYLFQPAEPAVSLDTSTFSLTDL